MPASYNKLSIEHSHFGMPSSIWLHVNGVSLTTEAHPYQPPVHSYDYRTKHLQSPVQSPTPSLVSSPTLAPYSVTTIDGPFFSSPNKPYQKLENIDLPKKIFIDRQIRKAKSLPGLIKGTALSRNTPLPSSTFISPPPATLSSVNIQDDELPNSTIDNDETLPSLIQTTEVHQEIRRPRVYFADFNKVKLIDDNRETSQQQQQQHSPTYHKHRRHRNRTSKKSSSTLGTNFVSPSIQQSQSLQTRQLPLSHQSHHQFGQELSIKKQQLTISQRSYSSRHTNVSDMPNQSMPIEYSSNETSNGKYLLQREKPILHIPKPSTDMPINSSMDISSDTGYNGMNRSSPVQDSRPRVRDSELDDNFNGTIFLNSSSVCSTSTNRQRQLLQNISLRQQFNAPGKSKTTGVTPSTNNNHQQLTVSRLNTHRSSSLRNSIMKTHDDNDDTHSVRTLITVDNRPLTANGSAKLLKRSDVIQLSAKNYYAGNTHYEPGETCRHSNKSYPHEPTQERFQNLLTVVRPPYASTNGASAHLQASSMSNDTLKQTNNHHSRKGNTRSARGTSARGGSFGFHITSNTIIV